MIVTPGTPGQEVEMKGITRKTVFMIIGLMMAGAVGIEVISPTPLAPKGPSDVAASTMIGTISGVRPMRRMR